MRRPWNIINTPIYSLGTYLGAKSNMNICTYVSAISMQPKQYLISVDYNTLTYDYLQQSELAILQILNFTDINLVSPLGKKSGKSFDKINYLTKKGALGQWNGHFILKNANAFIQLRKTNSFSSQGDHEHFIFSVDKFKTNSDKQILMFQDLIDQGIIL